jgi:predicted outer membrane repeat protein
MRDELPRHGAWVFLLLAATGGDARAATLTVGEGQAYGKIQLAIDAASDFDLILVKPGTYKEAIDFKGKKVEVRSERGRELTAIDATGIAKSPVVVFKTKETAQSVLEGFTLTGGTGFSVAVNVLAGGGVFVDQCSPSIRDCSIVRNTAVKGGGIFIQGPGASPAVIGCEVAENITTVATGSAGAGILVYLPGTTADTVTIKDTLIWRNRARVATAALGGGLHIGGPNANARVFLDGCTVRMNAIGAGTAFPPSASAGEGGGAYLDTIGVTFQGGEVKENVASNGGGLVVKNLGPASTVARLSVEENVALNGGGGFYFPSGTVCLIAIADVAIVENSAGTAGGGGMLIDSGAPTIDSCRFIGNVTTGSGGAIRFKATGAKSTIKDALFLQNKASVQGGGVYVSSAATAPSVYSNCIFAGNTAATGGGAVYNKAPAAAIAKFLHCTIAGNSTTSGAGGIHFDAAGTSGLVQNAILWDNKPNDYPADQADTLSYSDVENPRMPAAAVGVLSVDPGFVNPTADPPDLHLRPDSEVRDKGNAGTDADLAAVTEDFDGRPRSFDGDADGTAAPDMGAYELQVGTSAGARFARGDADGTAPLSLTDAVVILQYMFLSGEKPLCMDAADADDSGIIDLSDPVSILNHLYLAGSPPPDPGPAGCAKDPTADDIPCDASTC